ncbi:MAG: response regulator [Bacteroidetes bacterium]|nr:response regulator [Bacteroidota bacterium]
MKTDNDVNEFYSNILHEFRTPLTLIISPAEQILQESSDPLAKEKAKIIHLNANKLLKMINEMLDITKLENFKMSLLTDEGDIVYFIKQLIEPFSSFLTHKDLTLLFYSDFEKLTIDFDQEKMEKIVNNLISNAIKFNKIGGKISFKLSLQEDHILKIVVADTGIGILLEKLPFVFDRFYQGATNHFVDQEGTGIGLSLCEELVHLMNGKIVVDSVVDQGTEFTVLIPVLVKAKYMNHEGVINVEHFKPNGKKEIVVQSVSEEEGLLPLLLIVEDNEDMRSYLSSLLSKTYQIMTAVDGLDAFEKTLTTVPDIILSDIMMPRMTGIELCEKIKKDNRTSHIPILLLTAMAADEKRITGFEFGADDYLSKPFNTNELLVRLKNLIDNRERLRNFYRGHPLLDTKTKHSVRELEFIDKLKKFVDRNVMNESLSVEDLSEEAAMSTSQLNRKLKALLNITPNHFIRKHRLTLARELLLKREGNISEICYRVGFSSPAYFTKCFSEEFKILPSEL